MEYRLAQQLSGYKKLDPEPGRVQPLPLPLLDIVYHQAMSHSTPLSLAVADLAYTALFFLCRPGEYCHPTHATSHSAPFRLCDVTFRTGLVEMNAATHDTQHLLTATAVTLTYTTQKNGVRGEKIMHGRSNHPYACPVLAILRRVLHLRLRHAQPTTPLHQFYDPLGNPQQVYARHITEAVRRAATSSHVTFGLDPTKLSARSLRAGGAMALLCSKVDTDIIKLVGRWRSDEMLRYLHAQAYPLMRSLATGMVHHGAFTFAPGHFVPQQAIPILDQVQVPPTPAT
jgi:hypothetical protein